VEDVSAWLTAWWGPALAFIAGVVSFASPCVLPLVPGYVAFVSGQGPGGGEAAAPTIAGGATVTAERVAARPVVPMVLFVAGFAVVFTALGAFSRVFVPLFRSTWGLRIAGAVVLALGIYLILFALGKGGARLFAERRPFLERVKPGSAFPLGMAFAAGFTPCIGPVLGGIYGLAAAQGGGTWGALLMFSYSLGLGLPFILVGMGLHRLMGALGWVKRNYHWIAGAGGVVMTFIGVLLILNLWTLFLARTGLLDLISGFEPPI
jgi:cytochrome c-type biogenesis protein